MPHFEVNGIDVSKWQGRMVWPVAVEAGAKFAFIRAGSINSWTGVCYEDYEYQRNSVEAPDLLPTGAYFYFRPNFSPEYQAEYFYDLTKDKNFRLPLVADIEEEGNLSLSVRRDRVLRFLQKLEILSGRRPMIYTGTAWWDYWMGAVPWAAEYRLWLAQYNSWIAEPTIPYSFLNWRIWQWSADGNGLGPTYGATGSKSIDLNRYLGSWELFEEEFLDEDEVTPPAPPEEGEYMKVTVLVNGLRIRNAPTTSAGIVGYLYTGNQPEKLEEKVYSSENIWYRIGWNQWTAKRYNGVTYIEG